VKMIPEKSPDESEAISSPETKCLFIFSSVHHVMKAEKLLKNRGFKIDLIPMPREISSDCGVAIELPLEVQEEAWIFLKESRLPILVSYVKNHERYEMSERPSFGHPSIDEGRNV
jgi:hypothetical protein